MSLTKEAVTTALRGVATPMGNLIDTGIARAITLDPNGAPITLKPMRRSPPRRRPPSMPG